MLKLSLLMLILLFFHTPVSSNKLMEKHIKIHNPNHVSDLPVNDSWNFILDEDTIYDTHSEWNKFRQSIVKLYTQASKFHSLPEWKQLIQSLAVASSEFAQLDSQVLLQLYLPSISKDQVIDNLYHGIHARIRTSDTKQAKFGVGVFAIRKIPKHTNPFVTPYGDCVPTYTVLVHQNETLDMPTHVQELINDFTFEKEEEYFELAKNGFNEMHVPYYVNSVEKAEDANVEMRQVKYCNGPVFYTTRDVLEGEELFFHKK